MKCPLSAKIDYMADNKLHTSWADCLQEECAWWSDEMEQCDPTGLIPWLKQVKEAIQDVRDQMPVKRE